MTGLQLSKLIPPIATTGLIDFSTTCSKKFNEACGAFGFVFVGKQAPKAI
jgi:hypothetical protein